MSDHAQQLAGQAQLYQQQMQGIAMQKEALNMQVQEINGALDDLEKTKEKTVYKASGPLLIKSSKEDVVKDLGEKKDLIDSRFKLLERSETKIKAKIDELREKITKAGMGS